MQQQNTKSAFECYGTRGGKNKPKPTTSSKNVSNLMKSLQISLNEYSRKL